MSQVNLLPPEILQRQRYQRLVFLIAAGGALVLALILLFYLLQVNTLGGVNDDIATQEITNEGVQDSIGELQKYATLQSEAQEKQALLDTAYAGEVSMYGMLLDLSRIIPTDQYFTSLSITTSEPGAETTVGDTTLVGSITTSGQAAGVDTVASWITRMESVRGWVNPWVASITETGPGTKLYTLSSSVDLTPEVFTKRGQAAFESSATGGDTTDAAG